MAQLSPKRIGQVMRDGFVLNERLAEFFAESDILVTPCLPLEAFSAHGPMPRSVDGEKLANPMHVVGLYVEYEPDF